MVIAPIKKKSVVEVLPKCFSITSLTARGMLSPNKAAGKYCSGPNIKIVQHPTNISSAMAALLIFVTLSMAIMK